MPSYDFEVDFESLINAAKGTSEAIQTFKDKDVVDLTPMRHDVQSDTVMAAIDEFNERWEEGMNNLMEDVGEIAGRLGKCASEYAKFDEEGNTKLKALVSTMQALKVKMD